MHALPILILSCTLKPDTAVPDAADVVSIRVLPASATLVTTRDAPSTQAFSLEATLEDGEIYTDFPMVEWSSSNSIAGEVSEGGLFTTSTSNGGRTWITGEVAGLSAYADVTVIYQEDAVAEGVPSGADQAFSAEGLPAGEDLAFTYPNDGVALPRNLPEFSFMWSDALGCDLYQVTFSSSTTAVSAITTGTEWTVPGELWTVITSTNRGDDVTVTLRGADVEISGGAVTSVGAVYDTEPIAFRVSRFDAQGVVYYWSTTDWGIVRSPIDEVAPQVWWAMSNRTADDCIGCHVVSRTGEHLGYTWAAPAEQSVFRVGLADLDESGGTPTATWEHQESVSEGYYATFDPSGRYLVFDDMGILAVYDTTTGAHVKDIAWDIPLTMPDWSPDGTLMVAVTAVDYKGPTQFGKGSLVLMDHLGDAEFGPPYELLPSFPQYNQYYPTFSPDSRWIAFNRSNGGSSYYNATASLWMIPVEGGDPLELARANEVGDLTNTWPRWGPMPDDDVLWLAFASTRDYGNYSFEQDSQIWVTAVDTYAAEDGYDPSYPAFRYVQQDLATSNHAPWWSLY